VFSIEKDVGIGGDGNGGSIDAVSLFAEFRGKQRGRDHAENGKVF
jgi:hypothetical protein